MGHNISTKKKQRKLSITQPNLIIYSIQIFIGGLKPELTDEEIRTHFSQYGNIIEFDMAFDKTKKQRKGFGFITFEKEETMKQLIKKQKVIE